MPSCVVNLPLHVRPRRPPGSHPLPLEFRSTLLPATIPPEFLLLYILYGARPAHANGVRGGDSGPPAAQHSAGCAVWGATPVVSKSSPNTSLSLTLAVGG